MEFLPTEALPTGSGPGNTTKDHSKVENRGIPQEINQRINENHKGTGGHFQREVREVSPTLPLPLPAEVLCNAGLYDRWVPGLTGSTTNNKPGSSKSLDETVNKPSSLQRNNNGRAQQITGRRSIWTGQFRQDTDQHQAKPNKSTRQPGRRPTGSHLGTGMDGSISASGG